MHSGQYYGSMEAVGAGGVEHLAAGSQPCRCSSDLTGVAADSSKTGIKVDPRPLSAEVRPLASAFASVAGAAGPTSRRHPGRYGRLHPEAAGGSSICAASRIGGGRGNPTHGPHRLRAAAASRIGEAGVGRRAPWDPGGSQRPAGRGQPEIVASERPMLSSRFGRAGSSYARAGRRRIENQGDRP